MTYEADDFSGFGPLTGDADGAGAAGATASVLRSALGFMDSEGRAPTNRESLDVLSAIASLRSGDALAARMFARRALSFSERRAVSRPDEQRLYTTAALRAALAAALHEAPPTAAA